MKILIVDDDENTRVLLTSIFEARNHSVLAALNGAMALEHARKYKPDLIVSDILMPDMDGYELCGRIKKEKDLKKVPFVLFSGVFMDTKDIEYARSIGVSHFLSKPIHPRTLVSEVESLVDGASDQNTPESEKIVRLEALDQGNHVRWLTKNLYNKVQELGREKEALESKDEQLHLITDSLPEMLAEIDTDFRYLYVNRAYAKTFGFLQKTIKGVHIRDVAGSRAYALMRPELRKAAKGNSVSYKAWLQIAAGDSRYVWFRMIPRRDAAQKVVAVVIFMSDITHLHEVETALHERDMLLSSLLNNSPLALFSVSVQGLIMVSEGAGLSLLGREPGKDVGQPVTAVYRQHPRLLEHIGRALKGERFEVEAVLNQRQLKLSFTPQNDEEGNLLGSICVVMDESERARLEREVANVSAVEQKRIGQDLHDSLGQLLTGIGLLSKALESKLSMVSSPVAVDAERISSLASEATRIAKQAVSGLLPVVTEEHGLQIALETLLNNTQEMHEIRCDLRLDADIESLDHQIATQIYLILSEAVSNSIKHADAEEIIVGCEGRSDGYLFYARDYRSQKKRHKLHSGGMGLNIMKYRSRMIGASFDIDWGESGTQVSCFMPAIKRQNIRTSS